MHTECFKQIEQLQAEIKAKDEEIERLKDGFERIENWSKAYPLDLFPKPDLRKAAKVLKENGMTLGSISIDTMRHILNGISRIVEQALKGGE